MERRPSDSTVSADGPTRGVADVRPAAPPSAGAADARPAEGPLRPPVVPGTHECPGGATPALSPRTPTKPCTTPSTPATVTNGTPRSSWPSYGVTWNA